MKYNASTSNRQGNHWSQLTTNNGERDPVQKSINRLGEGGTQAIDVCILQYVYYPVKGFVTIKNYIFVH